MLQEPIHLPDVPRQRWKNVFLQWWAAGEMNNGADVWCIAYREAVEGLVTAKPNKASEQQVKMDQL